MLYTVGKMASKLGIPPSTLRYYDKEGLLPFVERSKGGIRVFKESDFDWLAIIECLKKTGLSIKNIKKFIDGCLEGDATIEQRLGLIQGQKQQVEELIRQLQETMEMLDYKEWYYEIAKAAGTCDVHKNMPEEEIPKRIREIRARLHEESQETDNRSAGN